MQLQNIKFGAVLVRKSLLPSYTWYEEKKNESRMHIRGKDYQVFHTTSMGEDAVIIPRNAPTGHMSDEWNCNFLHENGVPRYDIHTL